VSIRRPHGPPFFWKYAAKATGYFIAFLGDFVYSYTRRMHTLRVAPEIVLSARVRSNAHKGPIIENRCLLGIRTQSPKEL
jgi:hypothetical protein